jgi:histidine triad (HIT) family protein
MIANDEMSARKVYEDDYVVAFDDIAPQAPVHTLIIPRQHFASMSDDVPEEIMSAVFRAVPQVAEVKGLSEDGYRVIVNNGKHANQTVGHLHVHIMGGRPMSHGMVNFEE